MYLLESKLLQRITDAGIQVSEAKITRRFITPSSSWSNTRYPKKGIPLIEQDSIQTMPLLNNRLTYPDPTWEQLMKHTWQQYNEHLNSYTVINKYIGIEIQSAETLWVVSDGGLDDNLGYYGWVIANSSQILCEGRGLDPGNPEKLDSLRTERAGMLHALTVMSQFATYLHFTGKIILASDNLILVKRTKPMRTYSTRLPRSYEDPRMDIQCAIDDIIVKYFCNIDILYVRGHQDSKANAPLTWL